MNTYRKLRYILYILLSILCVYALFPTQLGLFRAQYDYPVTALEDGWTVTVNETVAEGQTLGLSVTNAVKKEDVIILTHMLPSEEVPSACLEVRTIRAALDVFLDDERIYSYGDPSKRELIYNHLHAIPLAEGYGGSRISLLIRTNVDDAYSGFYPVYVGNRGDIFRRWVHDNARVLLFGGFLVVYGLFLLILAVFMYGALSKDLRILLASLMVLLFGFYVLAYYNIFDFLFDNPAVNVIIELLSLYLIPPAITAFIGTIRTGMARRVMMGMSLLDLALFGLACVLHFSGILFLNQVLVFFHALVIAESIVGILLLWIDISASRHLTRRHEGGVREKIFFRRADRVLFIGVLAIILGGFIDTLTYNVSALRGTGGIVTASIRSTCIGVLIFSGCLLQNYFFYTVEHANELIKNEQLSDIAFTDPLTGLANRTRCEQVMRRLEEERTDYSVLSIDVDGLKKVNDTLGHAEGDRYLTGFASILKECFRESDLIGRMGGDEFIVILRNTPKSVCAAKAEQLQQTIARYNRTERSFTYSAACGYAHKTEVFGGDVSAIFQLADDRMYEAKRLAKENRHA